MLFLHGVSGYCISNILFSGAFRKSNILCLNTGPGPNEKKSIYIFVCIGAASMLSGV